MREKHGSRLPKSQGLPECEAKAFARALTIDTVEFGPSLPDDALGRAVCWREVGQHLAFSAASRPGLTDSERWTFEQWVRLRAYLLAVTLDPDFDGWETVGRRRWQLTCTPDEGPDDPFGAEPLSWL